MDRTLLAFWELFVVNAADLNLSISSTLNTFSAMLKEDSSEIRKIVKKAAYS